MNISPASSTDSITSSSSFAENEIKNQASSPEITKNNDQFGSDSGGDFLKNILSGAGDLFKKMVEGLDKLSSAMMSIFEKGASFITGLIGKI